MSFTSEARDKQKRTKSARRQPKILLPLRTDESVWIKERAKQADGVELGLRGDEAGRVRESPRLPDHPNKAVRGPEYAAGTIGMGWKVSALT